MSINLFYLKVLIFATVCNVGAARLLMRIVNGTDADDGEIPYVVQIYKGWGNFVCGGSIIGPKWILTAAHCFLHGKIRSIIYGSNRLFDGFNNNTVAVIKSISHPGFSLQESYYDVGLLQLAEPIQFGTNAQPIKLPDDDNVPFHVTGVLAGWGYTSTPGQAQLHLQRVDLFLLNDDECTKRINYDLGVDNFNSSHMLCSEDSYNGQCFGDSGGPFVIKDKQYGVVSWSFKPCGVVPGAYSRITSPGYREWIRNVSNI